MHMRTFTAIGACVLAATATISAQQQVPPADKAAAAPQSAPAAITVAGCVQEEKTVRKRDPAQGQIGEAGMGDEFVLTNSMLNPKADAPPPALPSAQPPAQPPVGTSGSVGNFGKVYRVTGDAENELKAHVGKRVEITGTFKQDADAKAELGAVGTSGRAIGGELTTANTPEITINAVKVIPGACQSN
jgi:hypothetical protein